MASKTGTVLRGRSLLIPYLLVLSGSSRRSMGRENQFRNQSTINGPVRPPRSNWGIRLILHSRSITSSRRDIRTCTGVLRTTSPPLTTPPCQSRPAAQLPTILPKVTGTYRIRCNCTDLGTVGAILPVLAGRSEPGGGGSGDFTRLS